MIHCTRTDSENEDFRSLVQQLDEDLRRRDGDDNIFYAQFNKIDAIRHVIVAYDNGIAVGCGAIKEYTPDTMEVKRMYVLENRRGQGIASTVLLALEHWAVEMKYKRCVLETGKRQVEAMALYHKTGYKIIPNYGQYAQVENSICFEKILIV